MGEPKQSTNVLYDEDRHQLGLLSAPLGQDMSGRTRYAAAMYFYQRGLISAECLEIYRILSRIDHENPEPVLRVLGLADEIEAIRRAYGTRQEHNDETHQPS